MRSSRLVVALLLPILPPGATACGSSTDGTPETATFRDSAGITIVDNPFPPPSRWRIDSIPLATAGGRGDSAQFSAISGVAILRGGRILVADTGERNVRLFDSAGRHVRTVVSHGGGPEELNAVSALYATGSDTVYVHDANAGTLIVLDPDARIARRLRSFRFRGDTTDGFGVRPSMVGVLDDGSFVTGERRVFRGPVPSQRVRRALSHPPVYRRGHPDRGELAEYGVLTMGREPPETPSFAQRIVVAAGDRVYYSHGDTLGFSIYSLNGRLERIVGVDRPQIPTPDGLLPAATRGTNSPPLPAYLPGVVGLLRAHNGDVWIASLEVADAGTVTPIWYVFDPDGRLIQRVPPPPFAIIAVRDDRIAGIVTDQDDVPTLVVHRLRRE